MGHPQPPTPVNCNNSTAVGIANNTVKRQCSRSMEMRFFWVADAVEARKFGIQYYPGKEPLVTIKANTILVHTIQQFALGTCMKRHHFENHQKLASLAL